METQKTSIANSIAITTACTTVERPDATDQAQKRSSEEQACLSPVFKEAQRQRAKLGLKDVDRLMGATRESLTKSGSPCAGEIDDTTFRNLSSLAISEPLHVTPVVERPYFRDGEWIGDLVLDPVKKELVFGVWSKSDKKLQIRPVYPIDPNDDFKGYRVPPGDPFDSIGKKVVSVPNKPKPYGTTTQLIDKIKNFVRSYYHAPEIWIEIMAYFALMTWVTEACTAVPYLRWLGEPDTGKTRGLQTTAALCYRSTSIGGAASIAAIFRLIEKWQGTLVIDEADFRQGEVWDEVTKILNQGYLRFWPVTRADGRDNEPRPFDVFGPKLLSTRKPFTDTATETRCITFATKETVVPDEIPLQLDDDFYLRAQELQNELLQWRIDNLDRIKVNEQEIRILHGSRLAQIGSALLSVVDDKGARERIIEFLGRTGSWEKQNRNPAIVLEALARIDRIDVNDDDENRREAKCYLPKDETVLIKHVSCFANEVARDLGLVDEKRQGTAPYLSMQEVGGIVRSLGFEVKRTSSGNEVTIDPKLLQEKLRQ
jgi:hypothetical protein